MSNHNTSGHSPGHNGHRKPKGLMSRLKLKWATGLMVAGGMFSVGHATPATAKTVSKTKTSKSVGKTRSIAKKAVAGAKRVVSNNFALLNRYKQELAKFGAAKLESYKDKMSGVASWYGGFFHGRLTASGRRFSTYAHVAAHRSLPFGTILRVTNQDNGKSTVVEVLDRGPYVADRLIDLSQAAADDLGFKGNGTAHVATEILKMGDLPYVVEAPLTAAELRGDVVRHSEELEQYLNESPVSQPVAEASSMPSPSGSFLYDVAFRNVLPALEASADAVATTVTDALLGLRANPA